MKARVIATRYPQIEGDDPATQVRHRREFGEIIEVTKKEFERGVAIGALQDPDETAPTITNLSGAREAGLATQPDGSSMEDEEGNELELEAKPDVSAGEWKRPRTHDAANEQLAEFGLSVPDGATVAQKAEIIEQYRAARLAGETPTSIATEDISDLDDGELIQRGVDFGLDEGELVELDHDHLVLRVAEAMNRQAATPEGQEAAKARLAAQREEGEARAAELAEEREG